jgi:peptide methionine sulfoxide reductase MsrA
MTCPVGAARADECRRAATTLRQGYHQQYLSDAKNPNGYCGVGGTGVSCPVGVARADG